MSVKNTSFIKVENLFYIAYFVFISHRCLIRIMVQRMVAGDQIKAYSKMINSRQADFKLILGRIIRLIKLPSIVILSLHYSDQPKLLLRS